jgi:hypothetical protein
LLKKVQKQMSINWQIRIFPRRNNEFIFEVMCRICLWCHVSIWTVNSRISSLPHIEVLWSVSTERRLAQIYRSQCIVRFWNLVISFDMLAFRFTKSIHQDIEPLWFRGSSIFKEIATETQQEIHIRSDVQNSWISSVLYIQALRSILTE